MEYISRFGKHFEQNDLMNNVGVIGDGKWAKIIIPKISKLSNVKFIINSKINYKILNLKNISWIFVLTNNETHYEIVKYFLNKKKNVFCEKPLSNYYSQVIELYKLAKKKKVKLYTNDVEFFKKKKITFKKVNKIIRVKKSYKDQNSLLHRLAYHDFYLLKNFINLDDVKVLKYSETSNKLSFTIVSNDKYFEFFYDINSKLKSHKINSLNMINFNRDPLKEMLLNIFKSNNNFFKINALNTIYASKLISLLNKKFI